jgi:hypothetical protein
MADTIELTDAQRQERDERFRYVDLTHPLMKALYEMQLDLDLENEQEEQI